MTIETIKPRLQQVFSQVLGIDATAVSDETAPDNVPQWDSLAHLRLVMAIEEEFNIAIPAEQVMDMVTFKIATLMISEQTTGGA